MTTPIWGHRPVASSERGRGREIPIAEISIPCNLYLYGMRPVSTCNASHTQCSQSMTDICRRSWSKERRLGVMASHKTRQKSLKNERYEREHK